MTESGPIIRQRKRLPHWEAPNAIYFVTFRQADSLPAEVLLRIKAERRAALEKVRDGAPMISSQEQKRLRRLFSKRVEDYLDRGCGTRCLIDPRAAEIVAGALRHLDGVRYGLYAWCVMPNHVHVVFEPYAGFSLATIVHSWKSFSAQRINRLLGRGGPFWQREYYDHLLRDGEQFARAVRYVAENPEKAGLKDWRWVEVWERD